MMLLPEKGHELHMWIAGQGMREHTWWIETPMLDCRKDDQHHHQEQVHSPSLQGGELLTIRLLVPRVGPPGETTEEW